MHETFSTETTTKWIWHLFDHVMNEWEYCYIELMCLWHVVDNPKATFLLIFLRSKHHIDHTMYTCDSLDAIDFEQGHT